MILRARKLSFDGWHTDKSTDGLVRKVTGWCTNFRQKGYGLPTTFHQTFWLSKSLLKIGNLILNQFTGMIIGIWPEKSKSLKNKFSSYPTQPWTLPKGLETVFQFKDARKTTKTGAKPSVQTHQELEQPGFKQGKEPSSDTTCRSLFSEDREQT